MKTPEVLSFHPGRQHNLEQAFLLQQGLPDFRHATSMYFGAETVARWQNISAKIGAQLKKRSAQVAAARVDTYSVPELELLLKRTLKKRIASTDFIERNQQFQEWVLRTYAPPKLCIGYDTSSWHVFRKWKHKSLLVLDLSIAVPQYKLELAKQGGFSQAFIEKQTWGDDALYQVYEEEVSLADFILCGSTFVRDSCISLGVAPEKLVLLPYGADLTKFVPEKVLDGAPQKLKLVFVGSVNYRKGADVLLKAWEVVCKRFPDAELHYYGGVQIEIPANPRNVFFHGFISQEMLIEELKQAHISVLPTFFEGSSLVIYQSMAMGLATITTPNAGSVIQHMQDGIIIDYGSVEQLVEALSLVMGDHFFRITLGTAARERIKSFTWDAYGASLLNLIREKLSVSQVSESTVPA